nr:retrovirus-related Pol polyprotein from transposon TNT 1-94 [Tanacetum cinerariifolium]
MDPLTPQVVFAAKLPILNPNEFDLWKMRIEQYFLMTDCSLWEVILNGDSSVPTRIVEGISQPVAPTTVKQRLARKNKLKARGLDQIHDMLQKLVSQLEIHGVSFSQEDVNLKFLYSLPSEWKTHTLIWRNKADLKEQNLDDLFNNLKIYETEVKQSPSSGTATQNLAFVSSTSTDSTTDSVSVAASVSVACVKLSASPLLNVDSLSNAIIYSFFSSQSTSPQFDNEDLKQIDVDDLEKMDLKWQMAMLTMRARRKGHFSKECRSPKDQRRPEEEPANFALMAFSSSSSSDNEVPPCSKACSKAYAQLHSQYDKLTDDFCKSQFDVISYQIGTFMPPKPDLVFNTAPIPVETDHLAFNVQLSPTKPEQDLSHTSRPSAPIIKDWVSNSEEESEPKDPQQFVPIFAQSSEHVKTPRHSVQPIETTFQDVTSIQASPTSNSSGKRRNRKACFICKSVDHLIKECDYHSKRMAQPTHMNYANRGHHKLYVPLTHSKPQKHRVPTAVLTQSKPVPNTVVRPVSAALPNITVIHPRHANQVVKYKSPIRRQLTRNPSSRTSNSPLRVNAVQVPVVSVAQGNMSYLSDFEELNGGYVAFGGNPKGGRLLVFFLATKDETSPIIKTFLTGLENQLSLKVKVIRNDNRTEFKNSNLNQFCRLKGIKREFSVPRTLQQNGIAERKNKTLIEAARTMLADSLLPIPFWAKAVNTACYVQNRVLVTKPHNKTPYELLHGRTPSIGFMRPFCCPVTILNTLDHLGKFQGKVDEGFLVGYSVCSKAFRVFNTRTYFIQETLHVNFLENKPNVAGTGPTWLFDIDSLSGTTNYHPITVGNQTNSGAGFLDNLDAEKAGEEVDHSYMLFPVWSSVGSTNPQNNGEDATFDGKEHDFNVKKSESKVILSQSSSAQSKEQDDKTTKEAKGKSLVKSVTRYRDLNTEFQDCSKNNSNEVTTASSTVPTVGQNSLNNTNTFSTAGLSNTVVSPVWQAIEKYNSNTRVRMDGI